MHLLGAYDKRIVPSYIPGYSGHSVVMAFVMERNRKILYIIAGFSHHRDRILSPRNIRFDFGDLGKEWAARFLNAAP